MAKQLPDYNLLRITTPKIPLVYICIYIHVYVKDVNYHTHLIGKFKKQIPKDYYYYYSSTSINYLFIYLLDKTTDEQRL